MTHGLADLVPQRGGLAPGDHVVVGGHDHEHVVDADAEADEGQHRVHRRVGEPEQGAEPHGHHHAHGDAEEPGQGQVQPDLH